MTEAKTTTASAPAASADPEGDTDAWLHEASQLGTELRACVEGLATRELTHASLAALRAHVASMRALLDGPATPRWYDGAANEEAFTHAARSYLRQSPVRGLLNPIAPPLEMLPLVEGETRPTVRATATLGLAYEGPPRGVHGGWVAALFDEVLGATQQLAAQRGMTARLTVRYRRVTPLGVPLHFEAWLEEQRDRRMMARATCHAEGQLTADATGLFVAVDFEAVRDRNETVRDRNETVRDRREADGQD